MRRYLGKLGLVIFCLGSLLPGDALAGKTVDAIKARGQLLCSADSSSYYGFAEIRDDGKWSGFDIDFCRALATALLGDPNKVNFVPVSWAQRFPALQSGELDVVFKATTWTLSRDAELGFQFSLPYFFAGTQLMVPRDSGITSAKELDGATSCGAAGSSVELVLADYMHGIGVKTKAITFEKSEEAQEAYFAGRCDFFAAWGPTLAVARGLDEKVRDKHVILPDSLNNDVISAAVRQGDEHFLDVVNWVIAVVIEAEHLGINQSNVAERKADPNATPVVSRILGASAGIGEKLGLRDSWAYEVLEAVGNYGEIFDRNLGTGSPYKMDRGLNKHWTGGGLLYAPTFN